MLFMRSWFTVEIMVRLRLNHSNYKQTTNSIHLFDNKTYTYTYKSVYMTLSI